MKIETSYEEPPAPSVENSHNSEASFGKSPENYFTDLDVSTLNPLNKTWQTLPEELELETSIDFLSFFDPEINEGHTILHPWQVEEPEKICKAKADSRNPFLYCLCACNGSGKDAFVLTPFAVWFICCKIRSRVIITSSSGVQLTTQTETYIAALCRKVNLWAEEHFGAPILKVKKRHIICLLSGSEIILFATDEEGKAEGYHPIEPNKEMVIIVNEAKSVRPEIFRALERCTGFNYFLLISTPGEPIGKFHYAFENWTNKRRISYYDCPHHSPAMFEKDKKELGEQDPHFRSKWLAEFTFIGGKNVVNQMALERMRSKVKKNLIPWIKNDDEVKVGTDVALSSHGDETVICAFKGNKQILQDIYRNSDATVLADNIENSWNKIGLKKDSKYNFMDDGGVGRALIAILRKKGWTVIPVLNQTAARNKNRFRNRGAELWEKVAKLIEAQCLILIDDDKLYSQIASRKYKETAAGIDKLTLESKQEMKGDGLPSPDRADALALALSLSNVAEFIDKCETPPQEKKEAVVISNEEQLRILEEEMWNNDSDGKHALAAKHSRFSLNFLLSKNNRQTRVLGKFGL